MFDFSGFVTWLLGAVSVVGLLEWAKGMYESVKAKNWKSVVLSAALPVVCFAVAFGKGMADIIWNACGMWSIAQLCYSLIVQSVQNAFKAKGATAIADAVGGLTGGSSPASQSQ